MQKISYVALLLAGLVMAAALVTNPASDSQIRKFSSQEELSNFVKAGTQTYSSGIFRSLAVQNMAMEQAAADSTAKSAHLPASSGYSATNTQVAGVDEADIVKTDGKYIYTVTGNKKVIVDAYPDEDSMILSEIKLYETPNEIFVNKDRLVVFGSENRVYALKGFAEEKIAVGEFYPGPRYSPSTFIRVYDISDRKSPILVRNVSANGNYFDSRMIGDYAYAIINDPVYYSGTDPVPLPMIRSGGKEMEIPAADIFYFNYPDSSYVYTNVISVNTQNDQQEITSKTFLTGYSQSMYVSPGGIYVVYEKRLNEMDMYGKIIDRAVTPNLPFVVQSKINSIKNSNISSYEKLQEIGKELMKYIDSLNPQDAASIMQKIQSDMISAMNDITKEIEKTVIHKISIDSGNIEYLTSGEVPGRVLNQFSMDEHDGYFRIATTTNPFWGSVISTQTMNVRAQVIETPLESAATGISVGTAKEPSAPRGIPTTSRPVTTVIEQPPAARAPTTANHVYILDSNLKIVGKIEDLAPGERIYSVRFIGGKGYMVTFRQIDPLFVIDLTPGNPKVLGYLKIPGVSDYLHPYDETHIIGIGRDATEQGMIQGLKLALFDVTDVSNPKEISKYIIGERGTDSEALRDHKAFLFSKEKNLLVLPISLVEGGIYNAFQGAFVFNVDLDSGFALKGKITHVTDEKLRPAKDEPVGAERKDYSGYIWKKTGEDQWTTAVPGYVGIVYNDYNIDTFPGGINYYPYDYESRIKRSLYIENVLYTVSGRIIKMNSLNDLSEINKVDLPNTDHSIYPLKGI